MRAEKIADKDRCLKLLNASWSYIRKQGIDGAYPPEEGAIPNAMTTAEVVSALTEVNSGINGKELLTKAVNHLKIWQNREGYWTDPNDIDPWDVSSTSWSIWAMVRSGISADSVEIMRARTWLERHIMPDGGLPTNSLGTQSNTYATSYAFRAFIRTKDRKSASKCLGFISSVQNEDGGWGLWPGERSEATLTSYVLHGLLDGGIGVHNRFLRSAVDWLIKGRKENGAWGSWLGEEYSVEGTAFSLYILSRTGFLTDIEVSSSLQFLLNKLEEDSIWCINGKNKIWVAISVLLASNSVFSSLRGDR
jgi:hypothetical protein